MVKRDRIAKSRRQYQLRARADAMDRTRARITHAAIELHGSIGPAATTMSGVAERAGVTRATLYRHFPNESALFIACSAEWRSANPSPDPAQWAAITDPCDRLATALPALYSWYRSAEAMRTNLLRDLAVLPPVIRTGIESYPRTIAEVLNAGWPRRSRLRRAAIGHGVAFETWQSLAHEGLSDTEAAKLIIGLISTAEHGRRSRPNPKRRSGQPRDL
ncbi:MAG TPA: helix-turn-helix domain-containing protein [Propionibacteriaceae bacterium]|nr:helix-turn-helix domain-containing protein [Propionibacteriaceae bacterium]